MTSVRLRVKPGVELQLEVVLVGEHPARLKEALEEVLQALDDAFGLRIGRLAKPPADTQLPAQRRELLRWTAAVAVDASLAIADQCLRQRPSDHRQRRMPASRSGVCLVNISAAAPARE
jgi:hypothetical protein